MISGYHFDVTFSNDDGLTTLKQMRNTSVYVKEKLAMNNLITSSDLSPVGMKAVLNDHNLLGQQCPTSLS